VTREGVSRLRSGPIGDVGHLSAENGHEGVGIDILRMPKSAGSFARYLRGMQRARLAVAEFHRPTGVSKWILATLIVWLAALLAGLILPLFMVKKAVNNRND